MSKKAVMISIDEFVHKKAKDSHMNISDVCEKALRNKVYGSIEQSEEERFCDCGSNQDLSWLCPDERWICKKCLTFKARQSTIAIATRR